MKSKFPNSIFILVGYGEELPELLQLRRHLQLDDNVVFVGPKTQVEVASLLNRCTVFALPSLSEGFPTSVLEAMSCRKPVVVSSGIGLEEVVADAGLYAQPRNPRALAEAIVRVLSNRKLAIDLGRRGRDRILKHYSWTQVVAAIDLLFHKAVEQRNVR